MPYEVSLDANGQFVGVRVYGEATPADHGAARERAQSLCRENRCARLLVDLRDLVTVHSTTVDCFSFGEVMAQAFPDVRIANILPGDDLSRKDVDFVATVSTNRGGTMKNFSSEEEALSWLVQ